MRDTLINNKLDIIYLIDVNNVEAILLNGYAKYTDERNILFVKDEILDKFTVSNNCFFNNKIKLAFVYLTPNSKDKILINNILTLIKNDYTVFGDLNVKSNKCLKNITHFTGEDTLQTGAISNKFIRTFSIAAPSDHRFLIFEVKLFIQLARSLKLGEISYDVSKDFIFNLLQGKKVKANPKICVKQYIMGLNDREQSINAMLDDFLKNNVKRIFHRYNYLWKFDRREPFLGKTVPDLVKTTYANHVRANPNKVYPKIQYIKYDLEQFTKESIIKRTKSKAINFDFISLENIPIILYDFLTDPKYKNSDIINNIIKYINENEGSVVSEVFFLQKNPLIKDFNDVRVIIIIPTVVKIYETLVFDRVMDYFSTIISVSNYQFGGIRNGSTYEAMLKVKFLLKSIPDASGIVLMDMSKGYDTVNLSILEDDIKNTIEDNGIKSLALIWIQLVMNMDLTINDELVKRTRGVPMGLSLSPIFFAFYVHRSLKSIDKSLITMYLDDLALVLTSQDAKGNVDFCDKIIDAFQGYELVINQKKTVYITDNNELDSLLNGKFKKESSAKYLGRQICLNGDGKISPDNRFYNLKGFRSNSLPFWATFFVKRLVFNAALDAKLRYRLLMWSCDDQVIRTAIWRNNWKFFKKSMGFFSYTQLAFCIFNIFRYFIDVTDVNNWKNLHENKTNDETIMVLIRAKLKTFGIIRVNDAIEIMELHWDWNKYKDLSDFKYAKKFINALWDSFLSSLVVKYFEYKKIKNEMVYPDTEKFLHSKLFKCFGILQNVVFLHFLPKDKRKKSTFRNKDLFIISALNALFTALDAKIKHIISLDLSSYSPLSLSFINFYFNLQYPDKIIEWDNDKWEAWLKQELKKLWVLIDLLLHLLQYIKLKGKSDKLIYENEIFADVNRIAIFVDGSYNGVNGGWGYVATNDRNEEIFHGYGEVKSEYLGLRNVAGELIATTNAIKRAINLGYSKISICYDYIGIYKYFSSEWMAKDKFIMDYVIMSKSLSTKIDIKFIKIPSHTGIFGNDRADFYAKKGAKMVPGDYVDQVKFSSTQIQCLKEAFKFTFKYLTIVETIYLNNNLNDLDLHYLFLNLSIKFYNLDEFANKQFNLANLEDNLDPIDGDFFDLFM